MTTLRVLFAPDYTAGNPYQTYLAQALKRFDVEVSFLTEYRRGLPLARGSRSKTPDIVHIHWPEKYFGKLVAFFQIIDAAVRAEGWMGREPGVVQPKFPWRTRKIDASDAAVAR